MLQRRLHRSRIEGSAPALGRDEGRALPRPLRASRAIAGLAAIASVALTALGLGGGCNVETPNTVFQVPGTPAKCEGLVYYEVTAEDCFTFGCTSGKRAFALCQSGAFTACACEFPCGGFQPAPGSPVPDGEVSTPCDAGTTKDEDSSPGDAHDDALDAPNDTKDAPPGDAADASPG